MSHHIEGSITALITPFRDGAVDQKAFQDFVQWQLDEGTEGFVPCGTTGEAPTLSEKEYALVTRLCVEVVAGKAPVIAGCGSNATDHAVHLTLQAAAAKADAALHVVPYYNKPSQEGLYQHFKIIHDRTNLPIVIYNIPGRSVIDMTPETMARLSKLPRIIGVKDATGNLYRPVKTRQLCGSGFIQLSGNDDTALAFLAQGGSGCISVLSNVMPAACARMHRAFRAGDWTTAQEIATRLAPLGEALFKEPSPAPAKCALALMGKCRNELRLPLVPASPALEEELKNLLADLNGAA